VPNRQAQIDVLVRVAYGCDAQRVVEILRDAAIKVPHVSKSPEATVFLKEFTPNGLLFDLMCFTDAPATAPQTQSEIGLAVHGALAAAGIPMPRPPAG
jgi:small-conductance mechanosensitive channel